MAASRRAQIQALCGVRSGALIDRVEAYLAAVDLWSRRGNAKAVKNAGTGVVAICCYLAAESLDARTPDRASAIRASGLLPAQFAAAERDFRTAVQSSNVPAQTLSGPSDVLNSPFAATLTASRPARPSPLATPTPASKTKQALLAKAQAIQAGSLFDQTMRATLPTSSVSKAASDGAATVAASTDASTYTAQDGPTEQSTTSDMEPAESHPRRTKRRRMGKVVFGLAVQSNLNRLDEEEEAIDERRRRNRINQIQSSIERLRSSNPTWRYLDGPSDFLVTISPSPDNTNAR